MQLQNDINPIEDSGELWTIASHVQTVKLPRDSTGVRDDGLSITCKYCTNLVIVVKVIEKQKCIEDNPDFITEYPCSTLFGVAVQCIP